MHTYKSTVQQSTNLRNYQGSTVRLGEILICKLEIIELQTCLTALTGIRRTLRLPVFFAGLNPTKSTNEMFLAPWDFEVCLFNKGVIHPQ